MNDYNSEQNAKIDITPPTSIYSSFRRLPYKPQGAIAEFVDNSTQSYYDHKEELENYYEKYFSENFKLKIDILYYNTNGMTGNSDVLKIIDNAYGMDDITFDRAMKLDIKNQKKNSRNEFGLGLKTSAIWFGDLLEVSTVSFINGVKCITSLDVNLLNETDIHEIVLYKEQQNRMKHGTTVTIREIDKRLKTKRQKEELANELASIYRKEISEGRIEIRFAEFYPREQEWRDAWGNLWAKGKEWVNSGYKKVPILQFVNPELLIVPANHRMNLKNSPELKKEFFENQVENENKKYSIKGWVGILDKGDRNITGFTLLRRDRVIKKNYRPRSVFGEVNGFAGLRVVGEVDLDEFPVIQSKEDFDWNNGLEDAFIDILKKESASIINFANKWRQEEPVKSNNLPEKEVSSSSEKFVKKMNSEDPSKTEWKVDAISDKQVDYSYVENNNSKKLSISFKYDENPKKWVEIKIDHESFDVHIYLNHNFLKPYSSRTDFLVFIKQFAEAYSMAYIDGMNNDGDLITFENKLNDYLEELSRKND